MTSRDVAAADRAVAERFAAIMMTQPTHGRTWSRQRRVWRHRARRGHDGSREQLVALNERLLSWQRRST